MNLKHLKHVVAAAEFGSLRAAARGLGVPQPSLTRSIHEIERDLGFALFERHQQGVRLTANGKAFHRHAVAVLSELRRARDEINQMNGILDGEVSVAMSAVSFLALLPRAMRNFRARYPKARLRVAEAYFHAAEPQLLSGELDFCVCPFSAETQVPRYLVETLFDHRWGVVARRGHPLAKCRTLEELGGAEWVRPTLSEHSNEALIAAPFLARGLPAPNIVLNTTSATATLLAVASSDLLSMVPLTMLRAPIDPALFEVLDLDEAIAGTRICLIRQREMPLTPMAEYFADMLRRAAVGFGQTRPGP